MASIHRRRMATTTASPSFLLLLLLLLRVSASASPSSRSETLTIVVDPSRRRRTSTTSFVAHRSSRRLRPSSPPTTGDDGTTHAPGRKGNLRRTTMSRDDDDGDCDDYDDYDGGIDEGANHPREYEIRFSRVFQRHVVRRILDLRNGEKEIATVVRSYRFLDEAMSSYPDARIVAPFDVTRPPDSCDAEANRDDDDGGGGGDDEKDGSGGVSTRRRRRGGEGFSMTSSSSLSSSCETRSIAGMGLRTMCDVEYDPPRAMSYDDIDIDIDDGQRRRRRRANDALRTLLDLAYANDGTTVPRHFYRIDASRIEDTGHTSRTIVENHGRIVDLLGGRFRNDRSYRGGVGGGGGGDPLVTTTTKTTTTTADDKLAPTTTTNNDGEDIKVVVAGLAMDDADVSFVMHNFPYLSLYDIKEIEGLIKFLVDPLPDTGEYPSVSIVADGRMCGDDLDWPALSSKGYGAGLTIDQATRAMRMMPELLALYYEDSVKPSIQYMYNQMQGRSPSSKLIEEASVQLNLEGTDPTDAFTFAHLNSIGVSWGQLRILTSSLPLWRTVNLVTNWEILARGPVKRELKRPALDYLRRRLQIGPGDIYRLLKTHTRLSTYDACNKIVPTLDMLQSGLRLSSAELRRLILRMPSLVGMGASAFEDRYDFFTNEAGMSCDELKLAVLKQPSLLQYGVDSALRPKLRFLLDELAVSKSDIGRIIHSAPAAMGLSLTENLRPKVVSIMKLCALHPHQVGFIVSTSPQILLLSQKRKIEPMLRFLSAELMLNDPAVVGQIVMTSPRVLHQGLESSIAKKIDLLMKNSKEKSKEDAVSIIRNNPALLVTSNAVLEGRIERCPSDTSLGTWLLPSTKGRKKTIQQLTTKLGGNTIVATLTSGSLDSVVKIYRSVPDAAEELGIAESTVSKGCKVNGVYLHSLADLPLKSHRELVSSQNLKHFSISIFATGDIYPSDSATIARGQRRTGGLAMMVFSDGSSQSKAQFRRDFYAAAKSCLGIQPIDKEKTSNLVTVFPLVNPSIKRCELFACSRALRILEEFLKMKIKEGTMYDIKVYTDSDYTWKFVKSKSHLLEIGSCYTSQEMLSHLPISGYPINIDILHPLARSFSRLNGCIEPSESAHRAYDNARVEFLHSMDWTTPQNGGLAFVRRLKRQAKSAAKWQYDSEPT